jgi:hypothetical protein
MSIFFDFTNTHVFIENLLLISTEPLRLFPSYFLFCMRFTGFTMIFFPAQKVTPFNTKKLQEAINNGGEYHPGATHVKVNNHMYKLSADPPKRRAVAKLLPASRGSISHPGRDPKHELESKVVYRHIQDGDIVLVNRQV